MSGFLANRQAGDVKLRNGSLKKKILKNKYLIIMFLPGLVYFILFKYVPMFGIIIAFKNYDLWDGFLGSPWVGLKHFRDFVQSPNFSMLFRNTLLLSVQSMIFGFPLPIILALMINEVKQAKYKKFVQTTSYLPHFISTVVVVGIIVQLLSPSTGIISTGIAALTGKEPVYYMIRPEYFRAIYILSGLWQSTGWGSIIYLAALTNIDPTLYEAAKIDGASRFRRLWHVTLPCLSPTIIVLLILSAGSIINVGFEKAFLLQNSLNVSTSEVISTYVFKRGLLGTYGKPNFSFATAVGLLNSVVALSLTVLVNKFAKSFSDYSLW